MFVSVATEVKAHDDLTQYILSKTSMICYSLTGLYPLFTLPQSLWKEEFFSNDDRIGKDPFAYKCETFGQN